MQALEYSPRSPLKPPINRSEKAFRKKELEIVEYWSKRLFSPKNDHCSALNRLPKYSFFGEIYLFQNQCFCPTVFLKRRNITSEIYPDRFVIPLLIHMGRYDEKRDLKIGEQSRLFSALRSFSKIFNSKKLYYPDMSEFLTIYFHALDLSYAVKSI